MSGRAGDDDFKQRLAALEQAWQDRTDLDRRLADLREAVEALREAVEAQQRLVLDVMGTTGGKATVATVRQP